MVCESEMLFARYVFFMGAIDDYYKFLRTHTRVFTNERAPSDGVDLTRKSCNFTDSTHPIYYYCCVPVSSLTYICSKCFRRGAGVDRACYYTVYMRMIIYIYVPGTT